MSCNPLNERQQLHQQRLDELWDYWLTFDSINKRFTYGSKRNDFDANKSYENMKWFVEQRLKLPFDPQSNITPQRLERAKSGLNPVSSSTISNRRKKSYYHGLGEKNPSSLSFNKFT